MNAIGYDINERKFIDPFNGINDIKNGVINIVDEYTFVEDPLRLYRAIQFASRFNMTINSKTFKIVDKANFLLLEKMFEILKIQVLTFRF